MLNLFARRNRARARALAVVDLATPAGERDLPEGTAGEPARTCMLATCAVGATATVVEMRCGDSEACRLRALGLCEGARVAVVDTRHAMLLDVRGTRLALGRALTAGITVRPLTS